MTFNEIDSLDPIARVFVRDLLICTQAAEAQRDAAYAQTEVVRVQRDRLRDEIAELHEEVVRLRATR